MKYTVDRYVPKQGGYWDEPEVIEATNAAEAALRYACGFLPNDDTRRIRVKCADAVASEEFFEASREWVVRLRPPW